MRFYFAFAAAFVLAACSSDPVDPAVAPDENLAGDASADGLASPANAAAAEALQRAALPMANDGLVWTWDSAARSAYYGRAPSEPQLSIECRTGVLHITRHAPIEDPTGTLSFTGNGRAASVPVTAARSELGPGNFSTVALQPGDMTNAVARAFAGKGPVNVSLGGAPGLVTPPSDVPGRAFAACR
jgi:hypothetical protein